ncbi:hypothetical protein QBC39DRAFT_162923 [Podospora conica]|nr:hypothetical protein QBC39DRAFT_162923 [Schizothecium conicum]
MSRSCLRRRLPKSTMPSSRLCWARECAAHLDSGRTQLNDDRRPRPQALLHLGPPPLALSPSQPGALLLSTVSPKTQRVDPTSFLLLHGSHGLAITCGASSRSAAQKPTNAQNGATMLAGEENASTEPEKRGRRSVHHHTHTPLDCQPHRLQPRRRRTARPRPRHPRPLDRQPLPRAPRPTATRSLLTAGPQGREPQRPRAARPTATASLSTAGPLPLHARSQEHTQSRQTTVPPFCRATTTDPS